MLDVFVPAAFEQVQESDDIRDHVRARLDECLTDSGLRRQMDDFPRTVAAEEIPRPLLVGEVEPLREKSVVARQLGKAGFLEREVVVRREAVNAEDRTSFLEQALRHVEADETGRAGDEDRGGHRQHELAVRNYSAGTFTDSPA